MVKIQKKNSGLSPQEPHYSYDLIMISITFVKLDRSGTSGEPIQNVLVSLMWILLEFRGFTANFAQLFFLCWGSKAMGEFGEEPVSDIFIIIQSNWKKTLVFIET